MSTTTWSQPDTDRAKKFWDDYVASHDLSERVGQAAGIDPTTGQIWFGESMVDIVEQLKATGVFKPLFFIRVGYPTYQRKGRRH